MKARDVMTTSVITVKPEATVKEVAKTLLEKRISAVPVVDNEGCLLGIVSEGDLLHRAEIGTEPRRSWWLRLVTRGDTLASEYLVGHAHRVSDIMTKLVVTASPDTPLDEVARMMEQNAIKRIPIVQEDGELVGIVSRANLVQALATAFSHLDVAASDSAIRAKLHESLNAQSWAHTDLLTVTVHNGIVSLWGIAHSDTERKAIRALVEATPGVLGAADYMAPRMPLLPQDTAGATEVVVTAN